MKVFGKLSLPVTVRVMFARKDVLVIQSGFNVRTFLLNLVWWEKQIRDTLTDSFGLLRNFITCIRVMVI